MRSTIFSVALLLLVAAVLLMDLTPVESKDGGKRHTRKHGKHGKHGKHKGKRGGKNKKKNKNKNNGGAVVGSSSGSSANNMTAWQKKMTSIDEGNTKPNLKGASGSSNLYDYLTPLVDSKDLSGVKCTVFSGDEFASFVPSFMCFIESAGLYVYNVVLNSDGKNALFTQCGADDHTSVLPSPYHIHYGASLSGTGWGPDECGGPVTGGHYDPGLACGPATGNGLCFFKKGSTEPAEYARFLPGSSADVANNAYTSGTPLNGGTICDAQDGTDCSSTYKCDFESNPYSCEVGDLSGKFGGSAWTVGFGNSLYTNGVHFETAPLPYFKALGEPEKNAQAIVFHCGSDKSRVFCGQITK